MLNYLIAYFSLPLGKLLNHIAQEEIKPYKRYLLFAKYFLISILIISLLYSNTTTRTLVGVIIGFLVFKPIKNFYLTLGLASFISSLTFSPLTTLSLTFLYTLLHSSLTKYSPKDFILSSLLFLLPFSLIFIETLINQNSSLLLGLVVGGLLTQLWARGSAW